MVLVVHAEYRPQALAVQPAFCRYAIVVWNSAGMQACGRTGAVGVGKRVLRLRVDTSVLQEPVETSLSKKGRKCLQVVSAQLVYHHIDDYPRQCGGILCFCSAKGEQDGQSGK